MDFTALLEMLKAVPAEVLVPALGVFVTLGLLKASKVVPPDNAARLTALALSYFAGGGQGINTLGEGIEASGIAFVASLYYLLWKNFGRPGVDRLIAELTHKDGK